MHKLFFRLYILLVITIVGVSWSLDRVFDKLIEGNKEVTEVENNKESFYLLIQNLLAMPKDNWEAYLNNVAKHFGFSLIVEPLAEVGLMDNDMDRLGNGEIITLYGKNGDTHHKRIGNTQYVLTLGPIKVSRGYTKIEILLAAVFYICIAIAVLIWLWPLWRGLSQLDKAAAAFGRGEFNARAEISPTSMVVSLATTFNSMADRIQRLIDSHKELTSAVSHELRTPIARLRFGMEMLEVNVDQESHDRYMHGMQSDIDELDVLVAEMLNYAMFDREKPDVKISLQDISPWLFSIVEDAKIDAGAITLNCQCMSQTSVINAAFEPRFMARAISNLIRNAIRYAQHNVNVVLNISGDSCFIHVDDDGPGLPEKEKERVFEPFTRHDTSRDRRSGGYGLGLAIVRQISEWHGGKASVSESPLGGARFTIQWPGLNHRKMAKQE